MHFHHYIAVDWSMATMAIARLTALTDRLVVHEAPSSLEELKIYLSSLKGTKIITFEESNNSQWLYVELKEYVDKIFICDPNRNRLLSEGPKTDKIDARKLVQLLKANLMKEVYHSTDRIIYLRKLTSYYRDLVRTGVMGKNQRSALFRSYGLDHKRDTFQSQNEVEDFVLKQLDVQTEVYEQVKKEYETKFKELVRELPRAKLLKSIPGIGDIHAIEILAILIDVNRFLTIGHLYSYAGLIRHEKLSGGRSYGSRRPRYSRELKRIIKMATFSSLSCKSENKISKYYQYLLDQGMATHNARHACSRKIMSYVYGVLKSERKLDPTKY